MRLYRYRPINTAILELSNCNFRFSSKEELNDPLESYVRLYWQGDKPAWEGLFRNYICSLYMAIEFYLLKGGKEDIYTQSVMIDIHAYDDLPMGGLLKEAEDEFLDLFTVQWIIKLYSSHNLKCGTK